MIVGRKQLRVQAQNPSSPANLVPNYESCREILPCELTRFHRRFRVSQAPDFNVIGVSAIPSIPPLVSCKALHTRRPHKRVSRSKKHENREEVKLDPGFVLRGTATNALKSNRSISLFNSKKTERKEGLLKAGLSVCSSTTGLQKLFAAGCLKRK